MDTRLIRQAIAGNEQAFTRLLGQVRDQIFRWAFIITADSDDAEDTAQLVSITLHRKLHTFRDEAGFETWLYRVVRNAALESRRRVHHTREIALDVEAVQETLSPATEDKLTAIDNARSAALIRAMFTKLPARQRELIELVDTQGYKAVEAAEIMGIEPETARVHLMRARRTLRTRMLEEHPERFA